MSGSRLEGKCALITGASAGIGCAMTKLFAAHGAQVATVSRRLQDLELSGTAMRSLSTENLRPGF